MEEFERKENMKTKINKISIAAVVGVFAIAMFAALAWSTVAGNALATDNEVTETANVEAPEIAAEETAAKVAEPEATEAKEAADEDAEAQPNAEVQISFDVVGLDEGVTPVFTLVDKGEQIDYKLGDKLPIDASESQIRYGTKNNPAITIQDKNHYYNFRASCLGYDFDSYVPPKPTKHIQEDTDFKMVFKKSTDPYNIEITLRDEGGSEIEGVEANFYNKN